MVQVDSGGPMVEAPGAVATGLAGVSLPLPFGPISAFTSLLGPACVLTGWSIREATGLAGAVIEIVSGGAGTFEVLAEVALTAGFDPTASQTPAAQTASGANAAQVASITAGAGLFAFLTSLRINGLGATAASVVTATLTGVQGGTLSYPVSVPAGVTVPITPVTDTFGTRGIQSAAAGGTISLNLPAFGAGNTLELAEVSGYVQASAGTERTAGPASDGVQARNGLAINVISGSVKGVLYFQV